MNWKGDAREYWTKLQHTRQKPNIFNKSTSFSGLTKAPKDYTKTKKSGIEPPKVAELGSGVWVGGAGTPAEEQGVKVLGSSVGSTPFIESHGV